MEIWSEISKWNVIFFLLKGSGRSVEGVTTDDVKSERLAAEQQLSLALTTLQSRHGE